MGKATIFNGNFIKTLKGSLKLAGNVQILSGDSDDPTSVAKNAPINSLYFRDGTSEIYQKVDAGSSTNWVKLANQDDVVAALGALSLEPTGFVNTTDSTLAMDDGTRQFSISRTGSSYSYYIKGVRYDELNDKGVTLSDTDGVHFIYFDGDTLTSSTTFPAGLFTELAFIATVQWDTTNQKTLLLSEERHGINMDGVTHYYLHESEGTRFISGLALSNVDADAAGDTDSHAQFDVDAGVIRDEDIRQSLAAIDMSADNIDIWYLDGTVWRTENRAFPVRNTGTGRAAYNQITGGSGAQTEVGNNQYVLAHVVSVNRYGAANSAIVIQGQQTYTTQVAAREGANDEVNSLITTGLTLQEFVIVGSVILQTSDSYTNTVKSRVRTTDTGDDYVDFRLSNLSPGIAPTDHGLLAGLGDDDHVQYHNDSRALSWFNTNLLLDEDDLVSDSDTQVPTQQSVKAYADTKVAGAASSTDDALMRFDGTGGTTAQNSSNATLSDAGLLTLSGTGLQLPASGSTTLDHYEEGEFNPTVSGSTSGSISSFTTRIGRYTIVGNRCIVSVGLSFTYISMTGNLNIGNMPVASASADGSQFGVAGWLYSTTGNNFGATAGSSYNPRIGGSSTTVDLRDILNTAADASDASGSATINFTIIYKID